MDWQRVGKYAIKCGEWQIAKLYTNGVPGYLVWHKGVLQPGCHDTADKAKEFCERMANGV